MFEGNKVGFDVYYGFVERCVLSKWSWTIVMWIHLQLCVIFEIGSILMESCIEVVLA